MVACIGTSITDHEKLALRVQPCDWAVSECWQCRGRAAAGCFLLEQRQAVLRVPDFQCSWLPATAQSPAESLSQDSVFM